VSDVNDNLPYGISAKSVRQLMEKSLHGLV
jgi:hypothetical protein